MTLHVYSARVFLSRLRPARHHSQEREGLFLVPSWAILNPALVARRQAAAYKKAGDIASSVLCEADAWDRYVPAYLVEMRESYRKNREQWNWLLAQERRVIVCYCSGKPSDELRCHRAILRSHILPKLGAVDGGELAI